MEYRHKNFRFRFNRTLVMGILNVTTDSFSDGGKYLDIDKSANRVDEMIRQGADIIDVGGESSRPGAKPVSADEEAGRVIPVIRMIAKRHPGAPVSIDTYKPEVAEEALLAGAVMINDISGLRDPAMVKLAAKSRAPVVVMHMKGTPGTMQKNPMYKDVVKEITGFFKERLKTLSSNGIRKIILDPGIGFGKTGNHNLAILHNLDKMTALGYPVLVGLSRKSFIGSALSRGVDDREIGTLAANVMAVSKGASVIRVHDVAMNLQAARMADCIRKGSMRSCGRR